MTLVLGQPGSGKSSLLKILSGRFPLTKTIQLDGEVSYNGHDRLELTKQLPQLVAYVTQRDNHFSTLSVQETLKFAYDCCGGEMYDDKHFTKGSLEEIDAALESLRALKEHHVDLMVQQLGLEHCQGTLVGDTMTRGVSGGERKRVTMGEMGFGNHVVNLMDEVSTGLDSAATFDIIKTQRSAARNLRMTIVIALLQPSPEVFALFDNVLLLNKGQVMYHGPCNQVVAYFQSIGLKCPQGRDVADFLLDLVTDKQKTCEATGLQHHPRSASEFAECFELSSQYHAIMEALDAHQAQQLEQDMTEHFLYVPEFKQSFFESTWTLLQREFKVTWRNGALIKGRIFPILILALIHSTLNYQFDTKDPLVLGTIFPAVLVHGLTQTTRVPLYLETREIIYKQRGANFYRTSSYVLATSISQVALSFIETWAYDAIVYWICGFVADVDAFLVFEHMLFVTSLAFGAWFFFTAALSRNLLVAEPISMLSMLLYILFFHYSNRELEP